MALNEDTGELVCNDCETLLLDGVNYGTNERGEYCDACLERRRERAARRERERHREHARRMREKYDPDTSEDSDEEEEL